MFLSSCYALGSLPCCTKFNSGLKIDQLNENCLIVMFFVYFGDKKLKRDETYSFLCYCANCGVRLANDSFSLY